MANDAPNGKTLHHSIFHSPSYLLQMTQNRRIFWNIVVTYSRSLYSLAIGLFSGRWVLLSLGEVDYGLLGVVGGMMGFVTFLNNIMASAVGRFYAYNVGAAKNNPETGLVECRKWFNTALLLHTAIPFTLMAIGYPCGIWAVEHYLTIPADRIVDCAWVWRFFCVSCFVGMVGVPFSAMFSAKQEIAEVTIYSFATATITFLFVWYMFLHPSVWLAKYVAFICGLSVLAQLIVIVRAFMRYQECRINVSYMWDKKRILDILNFSGGRCICSFSQMLSSQGSSILVNKMLGPARNAAMSVGNTVAGHCASLSGSFAGAYYPAITTAAGSDDKKLMRNYIYVTCSSASAAVLLFMLPICLEIDEVMILWLKSPPESAAILCVAMLVVALIDKMSDGLWMGIFAIGKVVAFQTWESICWFAVLPIAFVLVKLDLGILGVGLAMILAKGMAVIMKLYFARKLCGISIKHWCAAVAFPICLISALSLLAGLPVRFSFAPSFGRIVATTICVEVIYLPLCWRFLLTNETRRKIIQRISSKFKK